MSAQRLLAHLVQANVDAAAWTTDKLISYERDQAKTLARALILLASTIEEDDRPTRRQLAALYEVGVALETADRLLGEVTS